MFSLCAPALIYVAFSLTQIIIDTFKGLYNTALLKIVVMTIITILLNTLCKSGMSIVSWIIVFIPFILMSVITAILLYIFGLDPSTGKLNLECDSCNTNKSGNLIFRTTNEKKINTIDVSYSETPIDNSNNTEPPSNWSSDPEYE
jgi:hypothetical protein